MKTTIILAAVLLLIIIVIASCFVSRSNRTLLFENNLYQWKIYYVKDHKVFVGTHSYYEVFYKGEKLVLPKEITGGVRDVEQFKAVSGYEMQETNNDAVLIVFEGYFMKENGFEERQVITILVRPASGNKDELEIHNMQNGQIAVMARS